MSNTKAREWTLCYGEYDDPAWDGPSFDGKVKVVEVSAYQAELDAHKATREKLRVAVEALEAIQQRHFRHNHEPAITMVLSKIGDVS